MVFIAELLHDIGLRCADANGVTMIDIVEDNERTMELLETLAGPAPADFI